MILFSNSILCDVCRASKPLSNGWLLAREYSGGGLLLLPWDDDEARLPDVRHYCGAGCLSRAVEHWTEITKDVATLERILRK